MYTSNLTPDFTTQYSYDWLDTFVIFTSDDCAHYKELKVTDL